METVPQQFALIVLNQGQEYVLKDIVDEMPRWIEMMEDKSRFDPMID